MKLPNDGFGRQISFLNTGDVDVYMVLFDNGVPRFFLSWPTGVDVEVAYAAIHDHRNGEWPKDDLGNFLPPYDVPGPVDYEAVRAALKR